MNTDGSGQRQVIQDPNDWIGGLSWSPDSRRLAFSSGRDQAAGELYLVNADGDEARAADDEQVRRQQTRSGR